MCAYPVAQAYGQGSYVYLLLGILCNIYWTFGCHHPRLEMCRNSITDQNLEHVPALVGFSQVTRKSVGLVARNSLLVKPQPMWVGRSLL